MIITTAPRLSTHQLRDIVRKYAELYVSTAYENESANDFADQAVVDIQAHGPRIPGLKSQMIAAIQQMKKEVAAHA